MSYQPNPAGLAELGRSGAAQNIVLDAARRGAEWANRQDPEGGYTVHPATVTAGWRNDPRAGAVLEVAKYTREGVRGRILVRSVEVIERG